MNGTAPTIPSPAMSNRSAPQPQAKTSKNGTPQSLVNGTLPRTRPRPRLAQLKSSDRGRAGAGDQIKQLAPEPLVKTTQYILNKFRKKPPSLILHLHPTHFRFDQQDGTFGYNSPMKIFLEHLRAQTVPHDILEELMRTDVKFYDGCLIVEVHDHKSGPAKTGGQSASGGDQKSTTPFSIHNYNKFITPSPYSKFPWDTPDSPGRPSSAKENAQDEQANAMPDPDPVLSERTPKTRVFTTVMHSTPLSLQREISLMANWPVSETRGGRRQSSISSRDGSNRLSSIPPTPLSGATTAAITGKGGAKKQKMMLEEQDIHWFEGEVLRDINPTLYLHPADDFEGSQAILKALTNPLHNHAPVQHAGRKRTIAELAADEALAAEEERIALIMDENIEPSLGMDGAGLGGDSRSKAPHFQPDFATFKMLEDIRRDHEESLKQKQQEAEMAQIAKRDAAEAEKRRQAELQASNNSRQQQENLQQQQQHHQQQQQQQHQLQLQHQQQLQRAKLNEMHRQQALQQQQRSSDGNLPSQMLQQLPPHVQQTVSQAPPGSPATGFQVPNHSSPMSAQMFNPSSQGTAMAATTSTQGSPPRPTSAMPAPQPMVRGPSIQSQHSISRNSTPHLPNATPQMMHRNMTPQPRPGQPNPMMNNQNNNNNAAMNQAMLHAAQAARHAGLQNVSPHQQANLTAAQQMAARKRQLAEQQAAAAAVHGQGSPMQGSPPPQFPNSPHPVHMPNQMSEHRVKMQQNAQMEQYRRELAAATQRGMANGMNSQGRPQQGMPNIPNFNAQQHLGGGNMQTSPVNEQMSRNPSQMMFQQNANMQQSPQGQQQAGMQQARPQKTQQQQQQEAMLARQRQQNQMGNDYRQNWMQNLARQRGSLPQNWQELFTNHLQQRQLQQQQQRQQQQQQQQQNPGQMNTQQQMGGPALMRPGQGLNQQSAVAYQQQLRQQQQIMAAQKHAQQQAQQRAQAQAQAQNQQQQQQQQQGNMMGHGMNNGMNGMHGR